MARPTDGTFNLNNSRDSHSDEHAWEWRAYWNRLYVYKYIPIIHIDSVFLYSLLVVITHLHDKKVVNLKGCAHGTMT